MSGADESTGWIKTVALQYSPMAETPVPLAATTLLATVAPVVGKPTLEAGIVIALSSSQVMGFELLLPPQA
jgi:hypothetical protein